MATGAIPTAADLRRLLQQIEAQIAEVEAREAQAPQAAARPAAPPSGPSKAEAALAALPAPPATPSPTNQRPAGSAGESFIDLRSPKSALIATDFDEGAPGNVPIPQFIKNEALNTRIAETPVPSADLGNVGPLTEQGSRVISELRHRVGLSEDVSRPIVESGFERGLRKIGKQLPIVGQFIRPDQGASFKNVTIEDITNDPALFANWEKLSEQEKAFVLLDGTNKAADLLAAPQEVYDKLFGATSTTKAGDRIVQLRTGGLLGGGGGGTATTPAARRASPTEGFGGATGQPGATGPRSLGPGQTSAGVLADLRKNVEGVVITDDVPGAVRGQSVFLNPDEFAAGVNARQLRETSKDPFEVGRFLDRASAEAGEVNVVTMTNRAFRSKTEQEQKELIRISGKNEDFLLPDGTIQSRPIEMSFLDPTLRAESRRGPIAVLDTFQNNQKMFKTGAEIAAAPEGRFIKAPTEEISTVTTREEERATDARASLILAGMVTEGLVKGGKRQLAWGGRLGLFFGKLIANYADEEIGTAVANFFAGGDLTITERGALQKGLVVWVSGRRKAILSDTRVSDFERRILLDQVSIADAVANVEEVKQIVANMMAVELTHNELKRWASGEAFQFPVHTDEAAARTLLELKKFGMTDEAADLIVFTMGKYWELNGEPMPEGFTLGNR